ncbi:MAG: hypothetical protein JW765_06245 [Deltaproteobacteria bacterium]|nr:hypothetical protein [Candidatus Zymogenaceae bacterium]
MIKIEDYEKIHLVLDTFHHLDLARWNTPLNYNSVNYFTDELTDDEKLLTHWLCYITDRQMSFQRVWDIGGYVLSYLVLAYRKGDVEAIFRSCVVEKDDTLSLVCERNQDNTRGNSILDRYDRLARNTVPFKSRYMPEDLISIFRTLIRLDKYAERSLSSYIRKALEGETKKPTYNNIRRIASALCDLTYADSRPISQADFGNAISEENKHCASFKPRAFDPARKLFGRKRLWCSLRDYLKSQEFNAVLVSSFKEANFSCAQDWERTNPDLRKALHSLELPGDVWNNEPLFRKGLFEPYFDKQSVPNSWDMPKTIRELYTEIKKTHPDISFYPEQLDVSFNFVPKMCVPGECDICLFGTGIDSICHQQDGTLCSVLLVSCGYRQECKPANCFFKENNVKGLCKTVLT